MAAQIFWYRAPQISHVSYHKLCMVKDGLKGAHPRHSWVWGPYYDSTGAHFLRIFLGVERTMGSGAHL